MANAVNPYGDGQASERILAALADRYRSVPA
jgi:UDP-N-acetylglucosamine 2-epimerase